MRADPKAHAPAADTIARIEYLGLADYEQTWAAMRALTHARSETSEDQIWFVEHPPVFTLGQAGKPEHILNPGEIKVVQSDRGGQVTYHGPGQLIAYVMIDLNRRGFGVRSLVTRLEESMIGTLAHFGIVAHSRAEAPGVYVNERKIGALGLRVRRGRSYHGLALNVDLDLKPFLRINPCGYAGLEVTQMRDLGVTAGVGTIADVLLPKLLKELGLSSAVRAGTKTCTVA